MEGSEGEATFESLNLNPQQFINEVLNSVDDVVDGAFDYYHKEAEKLLQTNGTDRSDDLKKGVLWMKKVIQRDLDGWLGMWEKYCLSHCFAVPQGFSLPNPNKSMGSSTMDLGTLGDTDIDEQLESLRNKLAVVGKESAELNRELQKLERQSVSRKHSAGSVNEALQLFDQNSLHDMFQEMVKTASELRKKMESTNCKRKEQIEQTRTERIYNFNGDICSMIHAKGLSSVKLEDIQNFVADTKSISD